MKCHFDYQIFKAPLITINHLSDKVIELYEEKIKQLKGGK